MCGVSVRPPPRRRAQGARQKVTFPRTCEVDGLLREARSRPGGFAMEKTTVSTGETSTAAGPTVASQLASEQIVVVVASFSCLVFFVVVVLLSIIYHKDPHCCKLRSCRGRRTDMGAPPQYSSSRQMLVGSPCLEITQLPDETSAQVAQLFYVGLPSSYSLPALEAPLPRLPSYESVRKKDRQRQIHMMIADRFGLNGPPETEPPPTYEESIRQSVALPCDAVSSGVDTSRPESVCSRGEPHPVSCAQPV